MSGFDSRERRRGKERERERDRDRDKERDENLQNQEEQLEQDGPIASSSNSKLNPIPRNYHHQHRQHHDAQQRQAHTHIHAHPQPTQPASAFTLLPPLLSQHAGPIPTGPSTASEPISSPSSPASPFPHSPFSPFSPASRSPRRRRRSPHSNSADSHSNANSNSNSPRTPRTPQTASEPTSDEQPDLGAFTTVFREWTHLGIAAAQRGQMGLSQRDLHRPHHHQHYNHQHEHGHEHQGLSLQTQGMGMGESYMSPLSVGAVGGSAMSASGVGSAIEGAGGGGGGGLFGFLRGEREVSSSAGSMYEGSGGSVFRGNIEERGFENRERDERERESEKEDEKSASTSDGEFEDGGASPSQGGSVSASASEEFEIVGPLEGFQQRRDSSNLLRPVIPTRTSSYNSQHSHQTHHSSRSMMQTPSSFTRPPSSSAHETIRSESIMEGSTVWVHPPIANYLLPSTPSMERMEEEEDEDSEDEDSEDEEGEGSGDGGEAGKSHNLIPDIGMTRDDHDINNHNAPIHISSHHRAHPHPHPHAPPLSRASVSQGTDISSFSANSNSDMTDAMTVEIVSVEGETMDGESQNESVGGLGGRRSVGDEGEMSEEDEGGYGYVGVREGAAATGRYTGRDAGEGNEEDRSSITSRDIHIAHHAHGSIVTSGIVIRNESPSNEVLHSRSTSHHLHSHSGSNLGSQYTSPQLLSQGRLQTTDQISSPISLPHISISGISGDEGLITRPATDATHSPPSNINANTPMSESITTPSTTLSSSVSSHLLHIHPIAIGTTLSTPTPPSRSVSATTSLSVSIDDSISRSTSTSVSPSNSTLIRQFPSPPNTGSPFVVGGALGVYPQSQSISQRHSMLQEQEERRHSVLQEQRQGQWQEQAQRHSSHVDAILSLPMLQTHPLHPLHHHHIQPNANTNTNVDLDPRSPAARSTIPNISTTTLALSTPASALVSIESAGGNGEVPEVPPIPYPLPSTMSMGRNAGVPLSHANSTISAHVSHSNPSNPHSRTRSRHTRTLSDPSNDGSSSLSLRSGVESSLGRTMDSLDSFPSLSNSSGDTVSLLTYQQGVTPLIGVGVEVQQRGGGGGGERGGRGIGPFGTLPSRPSRTDLAHISTSIPGMDDQDGAFVEESSPALGEMSVVDQSRSRSPPSVQSRSRSTSTSKSSRSREASREESRKRARRSSAPSPESPSSSPSSRSSSRSRSRSSRSRSRSRSRSESRSESGLRSPPASPSPSPSALHRGGNDAVRREATPTPPPQAVKISTTPMSMTTNGSGMGVDRVDDESSDDSDDSDEEGEGEGRGGKGRRVRIVGDETGMGSVSGVVSILIDERSLRSEERSVSISGMGSVSLKTQMSVKSNGVGSESEGERSESEGGDIYVDSGTRGSGDTGTGSGTAGRSVSQAGVRTEEMESIGEEGDEEDEEGTTSSDLTPSYIAERESIPVQEPQLHHPHATNLHNLRNALLARPMTVTSMATSGVGGSPLLNPYSPVIIGSIGNTQGQGHGHDVDNDILGHIPPFVLNNPLSGGYLTVQSRSHRQYGVTTTTTGRPNLRLNFGDITGVDEMQRQMQMRDVVETPGQLSTLSLAFETPLHLKNRGLESDGGGREKSEKSKGKRRQKESGGYNVVDDTEDEDERSTGQGRSSHVLTSLNHSKTYIDTRHQQQQHHHQQLQPQQQQHNVGVVQTQQRLLHHHLPPSDSFILSSSIPSQNQSLSLSSSSSYLPHAHPHSQSHQHSRSHAPHAQQYTTTAHQPTNNLSMSASTLTNYTTNTHSNSTSTIPALSHSISTLHTTSTSNPTVTTGGGGYASRVEVGVGRNNALTSLGEKQVQDQQQLSYNPVPSRSTQGPGQFIGRDSEEEDEDEEDNKSSSSSTYALLQYPYPSSSSEASVGRSRRARARRAEEHPSHDDEEEGAESEVPRMVTVHEERRVGNEDDHDHDAVGSGGRTPTYYWDRDKDRERERNATRAIEERYQRQMSQLPPGRVQRVEDYAKQVSVSVSAQTQTQTQVVQHQRSYPQIQAQAQAQAPQQSQSQSKPGVEASRYVLVPFQEQDYEPEPRERVDDGVASQSQAPAPSQMQNQAQPQTQTRRPLPPLPKSSSTAGSVVSSGTGTSVQRSHAQVPTQASRPGYTTSTANSISSRLGSLDVVSASAAPSNVVSPTTSESTSAAGSVRTVTARERARIPGDMQQPLSSSGVYARANEYAGYGQGSNALFNQQQQTQRSYYASKEIQALSQPQPQPQPRSQVQAPSQPPQLQHQPRPQPQFTDNLVPSPVATPNTFISPIHTPNTFIGTVSSGDVIGALPSIGPGSVGAGDGTISGGSFGTMSGGSFGTVSAASGSGVSGSASGSAGEVSGSAQVSSGSSYSDTRSSRSGEGESNASSSADSVGNATVDGRFGSTDEGYGYNERTVTHSRKASDPSFSTMSVSSGAPSRSNMATDGGDTVSLLSVGTENSASTSMEQVGRRDENAAATGGVKEAEEEEIASGARTQRPLQSSHAHNLSQSHSHANSYPSTLSHVHPSNDHELSLESPSLGYLDEALRFIAAERAERERINKERAAARVAAGASGSDEGVGEGSSGAVGREWEEEEEWEEYDYENEYENENVEYADRDGDAERKGEDAVERVEDAQMGHEHQHEHETQRENERRAVSGGQEPQPEQPENPQPKKKRKRKRPVRAHAAAAMAAAAATSGSDVLAGSTGYQQGSAGSAGESKGKSKANKVNTNISKPFNTNINTNNTSSQPKLLEQSGEYSGVDFGVGGYADVSSGPLRNESLHYASPGTNVSRFLSSPGNTSSQYLGSPGNTSSQYPGSPGFDASSLLGTSSPGVSAKKKSGTSKIAKVKGKEREFLVPTTQPVYTILKRPSMEGGNSGGGAGLLAPPSIGLPGGHDSEDDGVRTPRGVFLKSRDGADERAQGQENQYVGDGGEAGGASLVGKKGNRVGRREREKEKEKMDHLAGVTEHDGPEEEVRYEEVLGEMDEHDEDDDEDGSLDGLSLLQPPQRDGHRKKDTAYIHTIMSGAYKSTPGSPRNRLADLDNASFEDDESNISIKVENMESQQVEQVQQYQQEEQQQDFRTTLMVPAIKPEKEKRKRVRPKRDKGLTRVNSVPDLAAEANGAAGGQASTSSKPASVKPKKSKNKMVEPTPVDMLHMDRSESSAIFPAPSSSSMRQASTRLLRQQALQLDTAVAAAGISSGQEQPQTKRGRLVALAKKLRQLFPEQHKELGSVIQRLERQGGDSSNNGNGVNSRTRAAGIDNFSSASGSGPSSGIGIPGSGGGSGVKRKRSRKNRSFRMASGPGEETGIGAGGEAEEDRLESGIGPGSSSYSISTTPGTTRRFLEVQEEQDEELDPRGRTARQGDVLVHVFIDHSNILIGLLSHLKRNRPRNYMHGRYTANHMGRSITIVDPKDTATSRNRIETTAAVAYTGDPPVPIPLPSFATASRSLPSSSALKSVMKGMTGNISEREINSDGYEYPTEDTEEAEDAEFDPDVSPSEMVKPRKPLRHLWHTALTLVLERGRPVTRRVVVASSPLYQPMEGIENLGYELRVFARVPDMGDGMDRERHRDKEKSGKSSLSSPATSNAPYLSSSSSSKKTGRQLLGHARHLSGSTSADSGSGSGGNNLHNAVGVNAASTTGSLAPPPKIKYREQGVDELLQLKLHQALAATDDVPPGSTIVLATGDGNMGQFNEDGFLGPVRTALKRGWHVELYAWEDGLSRAWRREFGDNDMFRIIAMEQFANTLAEFPEW